MIHHVYSPIWLEDEQQWYGECECGWDFMYLDETEVEKECDIHSLQEDVIPDDLIHTISVNSTSASYLPPIAYYASTGLPVFKTSGV